MTIENSAADAAGKIIPNSFQTPNFYVDECMAYLNGSEMKCLIFVARKTFGWQKRSDRISKSQIALTTGLNSETVDKAMSALTEFGLVLRLAENNAAKNTGVEWALQTDSTKVRFDLLRQRLLDQEKGNSKKTSQARQKRNAKKGGGVVGQSHLEKPSVEQKTGGGGGIEQTEGGVVEQPPQKPLFKTTKEHMGADAPARASVDERVAAYPTDVREGVQLMHDLFKLIPPEKPAPGEKGGEYAKWINGIRGLIKAAQEYKIPIQRAMKLAHQRWNQSPFTVSHPGALLKAMTGALAQQAQSQTPPDTDNEFSLAEHLKNFKPRSTKT